MSAGTMVLPAPFVAEGDHIAIELGAARAIFTTRRGGVSTGPYASLNLGRWTDDDAGLVERNRALVERLAGGRFAYGRQVHGAEVAVAEVPTPMPHQREDLPAADGQLTRRRGVAPMVLTADCLPVAIAAPGVVGMLHAGWRGLAAGVLEAGISALRRLGGSGEVLAAIGPGAGPCCYEVGEEVHREFADVAGARRGRLIDLKLIARTRLERANVTQIHDCGMCTMCADPSLFFSHRRDGGVTGRQGGVAWLS